MNDGRRTGRFVSRDNRWTPVSLLAAFPAGIDWFIPPRVRGGDADLLRRARLVVTFGCTLISLAVIYAAIFFSMSSPIGAAALATGAGVGVASLCVMRRSGSCFAVGNLITAAFFGTLTALTCRLGGHGSLALPWYAAVSVVALSTAGRRSAVFWLALTISFLAVLYALDYSGYSFPNDLAPRHYELLCLLSWTGLIVLMLGLALLYETAKDQMLRLVQESEERFKGMFNNMSSGVAVCNAVDEGEDFVFIDFNPAGQRIEKIAREDVIGRRVSEAFPGLEEFGLLDVFRRVWRTGEPEHHPVSFYEDERITGWRENYVYRLPSGEIVTIYDDVTLRQQAEEQLRQRQDTINALIETSRDWIWAIDSEFVHTYSNPAVEAILGYRPEELVGRHAIELMHPDDAEKLREPLDRSLSEKRGWKDLVVRWRHKDGSYRYLEGNAVPILDKAGELIGFRGIDRDITDRRRAEEKLQESEVRHRVLFESSRDAVMTLAPPSWKFTSCNPATVEMFHAKDEAEFTSLGPWSLSPEVQPDGRPSADKAREMIDTAMRDGSHFFEWTHKRLGGEDFPATVLLTRMDLHGQMLLQATVRDITAQKRAEKELQKSEERFRRFAVASGYGFAMGELSGQLIFANAATLRIVEEESEEAFTSKTFYQYYSPEDAERLKQEILPIVLENGHWVGELPLLSAKGNLIATEQNIFLIRDEQGVPQMVGNIITDITEQKRAEKKLLESESRLRRITDSAQDAILMMDPQGAISYWNPAAESILGYRSEEALGQTLHNLLAPERYLEAHRAAFPEFVRTGRGNAVGKTVELLARRKDGREIAVALSLSALSLNGAWHAVGILRDITTQKQAEKDLRESEQRYRLLFHDAAEGIALADAHTGILLDCNKALADLTGRNTAELIGQHQSVLHTSDGATSGLTATFKQHLTDKHGQALEAQLVTETGQTKDVEIKANILRIQGREVLQGIFSDITQRKRIERQQQQYAIALEGQKHAMEELYRAAEAANRAKSEFLANMSHEIRTPMTAILGFSDVLLGSATDRERLDAAATIKQNGEYLLGIINDILDLSKIEAGKLEVEHVQCSPYQILSEVVSLMRVRANAKNLTLEFECDGPIPQSIQSDPTRLRQILINLTGNAVKFTEVGEVRLVARLLDAEFDEPKMQFEVVDSGIGMTEEQIAGLFKPFHQADTSTTRKFGGTGLGLTISRRLAGKLGGDIAVKSTLGEGSTFTVTVGSGPLDGVKLLAGPTEAQLPTDLDENPSAPMAKLDCRALLAEDGADNQRLIAFLLKKAGAEVAVADNGETARDLALAARDEGTPFDVILMDMQMPVMDGYDATSRLREAGYTGPIIALTAHTMSTDRDKCLSAGCDGYMTKPIDQKELISMVAEYAHREELHKEGDAPAIQGRPSSRVPRAGPDSGKT